MIVTNPAAALVLADANVHWTAFGGGNRIHLSFTKTLPVSPRTGILGGRRPPAKNGNGAQAGVGRVSRPRAQWDAWREEESNG